MPNDNPALRKKPAEFAADAATRHPYPAGVPVAETYDVRAEADYLFDNLDLLNFSGRPFEDVEVWVNETYVVHLPVLPDGDVQEIPFRAMYDGTGDHFPTNNRRAQIETVRLLVQGEALDVPMDIKD